MEQGPKYRFPKGMEIPRAPQGMEVTKFHGEVRFISVRQTAESVNKAGFTDQQVNDLKQLEQQRIYVLLEELQSEARI